MIDLYTWLTPNGRKISIMLEETGLPYTVHPINLGKGEQFAPEFLRISPNNRIPVIVDREGPGGQPIVLFESGAILLYLAEKTGQFIPTDPAGRWEVIKWLLFQSASIGPVFGQAQHFLHYAQQEVPYAIGRFGSEARHLYGVLDRRLAVSSCLAGEEYTIADIATWPWIRPWKIQGVDLAEYPHVERWLHAIGNRPAVVRERGILAGFRQDKTTVLSDEARMNLFDRSVKR